MLAFLFFFLIPGRISEDSSAVWRAPRWHDGHVELILGFIWPEWQNSPNISLITSIFFSPLRSLSKWSIAISKEKSFSFGIFFFFCVDITLFWQLWKNKKKKKISGEEKSSWEKKFFGVFFFDGVKATQRLFAIINESKHQTGCIPQVNPNFWHPDWSN